MEMNDTNKKLIAMGVIAVILLAGVIVVATKNDSATDDDGATTKTIVDKFNSYNSDGKTHRVIVYFGESSWTLNWNPSESSKYYHHDTFSAHGTWIYEGANPYINVKEITAIGWDY